MDGIEYSEYKSQRAHGDMSIPIHCARYLRWARFYQNAAVKRGREGRDASGDSEHEGT